MKRKSLAVILCLISFSLFTSCYEKTEDCLERWASNYEITADKACDNCCIEPELTLGFEVEYDTLNISKDSIYLDANNNTFKHVEAEFFISGFRAWNSVNDTLKTADTISVLDQVYVDDYMFTPNSSSKVVAFVREIESLDSLEINFGIPPSMRDTSIITSDDANLAAANDSLFTNTTGTDQFALFNYSLAIDTSSLDTIKYRCLIPNEMRYKWVFDPPITLLQGLDKTITLHLDLKLLTQNLDLANLDATNGGEAMFQYLAESLFLTIDN